MSSDLIEIIEKKGLSTASSDFSVDSGDTKTSPFSTLDGRPVKITGFSNPGFFYSHTDDRAVLSDRVRQEIIHRGFNAEGYLFNVAPRKDGTDAAGDSSDKPNFIVVYHPVDYELMDQDQ